MRSGARLVGPWARPQFTPIPGVTEPALPAKMSTRHKPAQERRKPQSRLGRYLRLGCAPMISKHTGRLLLTMLAGLTLVATACGAGAVEEADVESSVAKQLAAETDQPEPNIDCPGDLDAEVGATMECDLTVDGDDAVYPVTVEVTSIEDGKANYSVEVGEAPESGGDDGGEEEPAEGDVPAEEEAELPAEETDPDAGGAE